MKIIKTRKIPDRSTLPPLHRYQQSNSLKQMNCKKTQNSCQTNEELTIGGGSEECGNASASSSQSLSQCSLRSQLHLQLSGQILLLEILVLSNI